MDVSDWKLTKLHGGNVFFVSITSCQENADMMSIEQMRYKIVRIVGTAMLAIINQVETQ